MNRTLTRCAARTILPLMTGVFLMLLAGGYAVADDAVRDLRLSGFGTLGYVTDSRSDIAPARDIVQFPKHGFRTGSGWKIDSRIGVQVEYVISPVILEKAVEQSGWVRARQAAEVDRAA